MVRSEKEKGKGRKKKNYYSDRVDQPNTSVCVILFIKNILFLINERNEVSKMVQKMVCGKDHRTNESTTASCYFQESSILSPTTACCYFQNPTTNFCPPPHTEPPEKTSPPAEKTEMDLSAVTLGTSSTFRFPKMASISHRSVSAPCSSKRLTDRASSASNQNPLISTLRSAGVALVFSAVMFGKFPPTPIARAEESPAAVEELQQEDQELEAKEDKSPLTQFLESSPEAIEALKTLLQKKVEDGEDEEILKLLNKLSAAQPENPEWKLLTAKQYNQMGKVEESRAIFEEILSENPLSFEALFENALLMNGCGEGERVIERLKEALKVAEEENKAKEARDVRLIIAQMLFLQKNVEEAMRSYDELVREDPKDFRPYFCKGMIYSLLDRDKEAREQFAKSRELSPKKFEVEGHFRTLSLLKKSGTGTEENK